MTPRIAKVERKTAETAIRATLNLDGDGSSVVETGIGFLDHLITSLVRHGALELELFCQGDLEVDDHHTTEDIAIVMGTALDQSLGERRGIERFGYAYAPLDEALARAVVDLSGRPFADVKLNLTREKIGTLASENIEHFIRSFATASRGSFHVDVLKGENAHHMAEAAFKALALALKQAISKTGIATVPSTKEVL